MARCSRRCDGAALALALAFGATACGARTELLVDEASGSSSSSTSEGGLGGTASTSTSSGVGPSTSTVTAGSGGSGCSSAESAAFSSGSDWDSYEGLLAADGSVSPGLGGSRGPARTVCLSLGVPANCPPGSIRYGMFADGWHGSDTLNGFWIWSGGVEPDQPADLQLATFQKTFVVCPNAHGTISVSCDDFAEVFVNGTSVGHAGSITDAAVSGQAQNTPRSFSLTAALIAGSNTVTVVGRNGPASFAGSCDSSGCTYAQNPAGVVFQGRLSWP